MSHPDSVHGIINGIPMIGGDGSKPCYLIAGSGWEVMPTSYRRSDGQEFPCVNEGDA